MRTKLTFALILVTAIAVGCTETDHTSSSPADVEYWNPIFEGAGVTDVSTQAATCPAVPAVSDTLDAAPTVDVMVDWGWACYKSCYSVIGGTPFFNCCCHRMCGQPCSDGV
jgi:hypothetical protein